MDSASSLAYPGSRILAGWWRQLEPYQPTALWVGYLFVHRVEALVESLDSRPIDPLTVHILQALAVDQPQEGPHAHAGNPLPARLHLPAPALHQLLVGMERAALVRRCEPGCWCLSEHGREVLQARADPTPRRERRTFAFVERLNSTGRRVTPPQYLPLAECPAVSWDVDEAHHFDIALLHASMAQPAAWQEQYGFPAGAQRILDAQSPASAEAWERVVVDRAQRVCIALIDQADRTQLGFAAEADGWKLHDKAPALRLPATARDAVGELTAAPTAWQEAWRLWCRQRHLPLSEADACQLHFDGIHLDVAAPEAFVQRLRAAKSDIVREESGLLAGDAYLRPVALLRLQARA
jgi:hypothetical protein